MRGLDEQASGTSPGRRFARLFQGCVSWATDPRPSALHSATRPANAPRLDKKTLTPVAAVVLFIAVVVATHFLHGRVYYPHVVVESQENVRLEVLQQGLLKSEAFQSAVATIPDAIRASCPACRVAIPQSAANLHPASETLLSQNPIDIPSS